MGFWDWIFSKPPKPPKPPRTLAKEVEEDKKENEKLEDE